jgi:hypothetical protein
MRQKCIFKPEKFKKLKKYQVKNKKIRRKGRFFLGAIAIFLSFQ